MDSSTVDSVLASLHQYSLSQVLLEVLVNSRYEHSLHRQMLIAQWPLLLNSLASHPPLQDATERFAFGLVTGKLKREVVRLAEKDSGWHVSAKNARADQLESFTIDDMGCRMKELAPNLAMLLDFLLDSDPSRALRQERFMEAKAHAEHGSSDIEWDDEDEYWWEADLDMSGLPGYEEDDLTGEGNDSAAGGVKSRSVRAEVDTRAERLRKRRAMAKKRRVALLDIRRAMVMSILMFSTNQKCNALATAMGMFFHSTNTPELVIEVFAHAGLSVSTTTIHNMITALSKSSNEELRKLATTKTLAFAYDNFNMDFKSWSSTIEKPGDTLKHATSALAFPLAHGVVAEDLKYSAALWNTSLLNPCISPEQQHGSATWKVLFSPPGPEHASRKARILAWHFRHALVTYLPQFERFRQFLGMPETVLQIPVTKTTHIPCCAMDIDQSTVDGQAEVLENLFMQANIGDASDTPGVEDLTDYVILVHGDLGTGERLFGSQMSRAIERKPFRGLWNSVFIPGLFHLQMAAADAMWRMFIKPQSQRMHPNGLYQQACKIRPHDSGRIGSKPGFRLMHDLILQCAMARMLDVWRVVVEKLPEGTLAVYAEAASWADIEKLSHDLVANYVDRQTAIDQELRNNTLILGRLLDYVELTHALKHGDIGRVEATFLRWTFVFKSVGKHKYATQLIKTMYDLRYVYPERLARAIRLNWLCNPTGRSDGFRAVDWLVELMNLYIKVVYGSSGYARTFQLILKQSPLIEMFRRLHRTMQDNFHLLHRSAHEFHQGRKSYALEDYVREDSEDSDPGLVHGGDHDGDVGIEVEVEDLDIE
ncbi:hypothetical protein BDY19DRAFT_996633 [Irpex rosettiformis]|uniref:Uncharacterized protein n=1 Tax=Irpex rosettiformis TaxID=378272 RepID=A0ACB8TUI9_9APHY|nr:hypothetical protein BDY19DRAFT_996633 [Irpex rosettiformis]